MLPEPLMCSCEFERLQTARSQHCDRLFNPRCTARRCARALDLLALCQPSSAPLPARLAACTPISWSGLRGAADTAITLVAREDRGGMVSWFLQQACDGSHLEIRPALLIDAASSALWRLCDLPWRSEAGDQLGHWPDRPCSPTLCRWASLPTVRDCWCSADSAASAQRSFHSGHADKPPLHYSKKGRQQHHLVYVVACGTKCFYPKQTVTYTYTLLSTWCGAECSTNF
jgi:hypothetical protein